MKVAVGAALGLLLIFLVSPIIVWFFRAKINHLGMEQPTPSWTGSYQVENCPPLIFLEIDESKRIVDLFYSAASAERKIDLIRISMPVQTHGGREEIQLMVPAGQRRYLGKTIGLRLKGDDLTVHSYSAVGIARRLSTGAEKAQASNDDYATLIAALSAIGTLAIVITFIWAYNQFREESRKGRSEDVKIFFEAYRESYREETELQARLRDLEDLPRDWMTQRLYDSYYNGPSDEHQVRRKVYIKMSIKYEMLGMQSMLPYAQTSGQELHRWIVAYVAFLVTVPEFHHVHTTYAHYYPKLAVYIDAACELHRQFRDFVKNSIQKHHMDVHLVLDVSKFKIDRKALENSLLTDPSKRLRSDERRWVREFCDHFQYLQATLPSSVASDIFGADSHIVQSLRRSSREQLKAAKTDRAFGKLRAAIRALNPEIIEKQFKVPLYTPGDHDRQPEDTTRESWLEDLEAQERHRRLVTFTAGHFFCKVTFNAVGAGATIDVHDGTGRVQTLPLPSEDEIDGLLPLLRSAYLRASSGRPKAQ